VTRTLATALFGLVLLLAPALLIAPPAALAANFIFLSRLDQYGGYNDVWGYKDPDTGEEYAILGTTTGTQFVNVTDPFHPVETGFIPGASSIWRDMHTYQGRAYIVSEGSGNGLQIVSLADPENPTLVNTVGTFTAHTIWIDEAAGIAYCNGAGGGGASGFKAYNLAANPTNPPLIMNFGSPYIHDIWVGGGVAYTSDIFNGGQMRVLDVSALPSNPSISQLGIVTYPGGATHNTWPHPDGVHVLTTDEQSGGTVRVFDVSDPQDMIEVAQFTSISATSVHNVYMRGDTAFCSWYAAGIRAFDVSDPTAPVNIGRYDTSPQLQGLNGCWSVYPYLPSGVILCADMSEGLVIVAYSGQIGTLSGTVTRAENGTPIAGASVKVPDFHGLDTPTSGAGTYSSELPGGNHTVIVSFPGYLPDTSVVAIVDGATTPHNVALVSAATGVGTPASPEAPAAPIALSAPYPNPTRAGAAVELSLPRAAEVRLEIYDASGRRIQSVSRGALPAGIHTLVWNGEDESGRAVSAGTYLLRLETPGASHLSKLTVLR
jgi:choice-of-anchor B domain-containing protein